MQRFALILFLLGSVCHVHAASYQFQVVDVPGSTMTFAMGVNNAGVVVGRFRTDSGEHGFVFDGNDYTEINYPGAETTRVTGINNLGQMVGIYNVAGADHGFLFDGIDFLPIDVPGADTTRPSGINDLGQIVGSSASLGSLQSTGFLFDATFSEIAYPGSFSTIASGISNSGAIVGSYFNESSPIASGFLRQLGGFASVEVDAITHLRGINSNGPMVGAKQTALESPLMVGAPQAIVGTEGDFKSLSVPDASASHASGVSDSGLIVGYAEHSETGKWRGFIAIPVPEPKTLLLAVMAALAAVAVMRKR